MRRSGEVVAMRRLAMIAVVGLMVAVWPSVGSAGPAAPAVPAAAAAGSLEADFNNDGFADLAVGADAETIGGNFAAGAVNVLYGGAGGLSGTGSQVFYQGAGGGVAGTAQTRDSFGAALAGGDFDHDGIADLAVGVPGENAGGVSDSGAVQVLYGSPAGLTGSGSQLFSQATAGVAGNPEANDLFGSALAAGDFDADGVDDLAVGVRGEAIGALTEAGSLNVLYGSDGGLSTAGNRQFWQGNAGVVGSAEAGDAFGATVSAGDFDHDGFADLAVGVRSEDIGAILHAGAVNVLYGTAAGLSTAGDQLFRQGAGGVAGTAERADQFGAALASGDFDQDGFADLAVGVSSEAVGTIFAAGAVNLLYGGTGGLSGSGSQLFRQGAGGVGGTAEAEDLFGLAVAAGDFDHNGADDLAIGAPDEMIGPFASAGAVNVLYGGTSGLTGSGSQVFWQGKGGVAGVLELGGDQFGWALSTGDFNRNGSVDLAVGVVSEDIGTLPQPGSVESAGAVDSIYGTTSGLSGAGSQEFTQNTPGVPGTAEDTDSFGGALVGR
jgi:FG-GAP repeat